MKIELLQSAENETVLEIYNNNLESMFDVNQLDFTESLMNFDLTILNDLRKSLIQKYIKQHSIKSIRIHDRKIKSTAISDIIVLTTSLIEEQLINSQVINKIFTINTEFKINQVAGSVLVNKLDQTNNKNQSQIINGLQSQIGQLNHVIKTLTYDKNKLHEKINITDDNENHEEERKRKKSKVDYYESDSSEEISIAKSTSNDNNSNNSSGFDMNFNSFNNNNSAYSTGYNMEISSSINNSAPGIEINNSSDLSNFDANDITIHLNNNWKGPTTNLIKTIQIKNL
jgi:hypothetical protein